MTFRPNFIELMWGQPDPNLLAVDAMRRASANAFDRWGAQALHYGFFNGPGPLIEWLQARIQAHEHMAVSEHEILITGGPAMWYLSNRQPITSPSIFYAIIPI